MKRIFTLLLGGSVFLTACNDKPEAPPAGAGDLKVYPNPALQSATIEVAGQNNNPYLLQVFDTKGELLLKQRKDRGMGRFQVDLSGKPKGKYHVVLQTGNQLTSTILLKL